MLDPVFTRQLPTGGTHIVATMDGLHTKCLYEIILDGGLLRFLKKKFWAGTVFWMGITKYDQVAMCGWRGFVWGCCDATPTNLGNCSCFEDDIFPYISNVTRTTSEFDQSPCEDATQAKKLEQRVKWFWHTLQGSPSNFVFWPCRSHVGDPARS